MEGWAGTGSAETPGPSYGGAGLGGGLQRPQGPATGGWDGECSDPRAQLQGALGGGVQ